MKNLPIGIQHLPKMMERNGIYVDKTELVHQLVTQGTAYFLSRPRRFGKSLLVSTLKELFEGNKILFKGLWIENNWDWSQTNPVIHISFAPLDYQDMTLKEAILLELHAKADLHGLIHILFSYLGAFIQSEVHSSRGRADVVIQTDTDVYIFEFKFKESAEIAFQQILTNGYANKYRASGKRITGIGVNFCQTKKEVADWKTAFI